MRFQDSDMGASINPKQFRGTLKLLRKSVDVEGFMEKGLRYAVRIPCVTLQTVLDTVGWST